MSHGPHTEDSPCWANEKKACTKRFLETFHESTVMNKNGYPTYTRKSGEEHTAFYNKKVNGKLVKVDNSMAVPYNAYLLQTYQCYIIVESVSYTHLTLPTIYSV